MRTLSKLFSVEPGVKAYHAKRQMLDRYGYFVDPDELLAYVKADPSVIVARAAVEFGRQILFVALYLDDGTRDTVKFVVDLQLTYVASALPRGRHIPDFIAATIKGDKRIKAAFFKHFEDDDEENEAWNILEAQTETEPQEKSETSPENSGTTASRKFPLDARSISALASLKGGNSFSTD